MPILGVIRETLEEDDGSMSGDDDFFSVASTMPLVADRMSDTLTTRHALSPTFDAQGCYTLVHCVQRIFWYSVLVAIFYKAL